MYVLTGRASNRKHVRTDVQAGDRTGVQVLDRSGSVRETPVPVRFPVWNDGVMSAAIPPTERRVSARVGAISESATLAVDAKAKALKAAGRPVIGFGAGEPDFPTPDYIVEAAVEACKNPKFHRYTPAGGLPELKAAIAAKTLRDSEIGRAHV